MLLSLKYFFSLYFKVLSAWLCSFYESAGSNNGVEWSSVFQELTCVLSGCLSPTVYFWIISISGQICVYTCTYISRIYCPDMSTHVHMSSAEIPSWSWRFCSRCILASSYFSYCNLKCCTYSPLVALSIWPFNFTLSILNTLSSGQSIVIWFVTCNLGVVESGKSFWLVIYIS